MQWLAKHGPKVGSLWLHCDAWTSSDGSSERSWSRYQNGLVGLLPLVPNLTKFQFVGDKNFFDPCSNFWIFQCLPGLRSLSMHLEAKGGWRQDSLQPLTCLTSSRSSTSPFGT